MFATFADLEYENNYFYSLAATEMPVICDIKSWREFIEVRTLEGAIQRRREHNGKVWLELSTKRVPDSRV